MKIIHHRRNTIEELKSTPTQYGVEIDVRSQGEHLTIHHDPFVPGVLFDDWIKHYNHGTLTLNVKESGLESALVDVMKAHSIDDYFFLDQSFPYMVECSKRGEKRCSARVSEYEPVDVALQFAGKMDWVWVDCFTRFPLEHEDFLKLKNAPFKTYLVSPEIQGHDPETQIKVMADILRKRKIDADAVCTKRPDLWEQEFSS